LGQGHGRDFQVQLRDLAFQRQPGIGSSRCFGDRGSYDCRLVHSHPIEKPTTQDATVFFSAMCLLGHCLHERSTSARRLNP